MADIYTYYGLLVDSCRYLDTVYMYVGLWTHQTVAKQVTESQLVTQKYPEKLGNILKSYLVLCTCTAFRTLWNFPHRYQEAMEHWNPSRTPTQNVYKGSCFSPPPTKKKGKQQSALDHQPPPPLALETTSIPITLSLIIGPITPYNLFLTVNSSKKV